MDLLGASLVCLGRCGGITVLTPLRDKGDYDIDTSSLGSMVFGDGMTDYTVNATAWDARS
eukprot:745789-Amphidinium_carterae.1